MDAISGGTDVCAAVVTGMLAVRVIAESIIPAM
jgi:hypothetical protein